MFWAIWKYFTQFFMFFTTYKDLFEKVFKFDSQIGHRPMMIMNHISSFEEYEIDNLTLVSSRARGPPVL